jgi:hypothetical protein
MSGCFHYWPVLELLLWLQQWHNKLDPQFGMGLGDFFRSFVEEEARRIGKTREKVKAWKPEKKMTRKGEGQMTYGGSLVLVESRE